MSMARKCDRCGKLYEPYNMDKRYPEGPNGIVLANIDYKQQCYTISKSDLCPECMESFNNWMKEGRKN